MGRGIPFPRAGKSNQRVNRSEALARFPQEPGAPVSDPARWGLVYNQPRRVGDRRSVQGHTARTSGGEISPWGTGLG